MVRLLVYISFFKFKVSAQSLTKGVFEFVMRNCVVIDDSFINIGCEKTFVSEHEMFVWEKYSVFPSERLTWYALWMFQLGLRMKPH